MTNTFSKLRKEKKEVERKLKVANIKVFNQIDELNTLNRILQLSIQEKEKLANELSISQNNELTLKKQIEIELSRATSLTNRLMIAKKNRDRFYKKWLQDHTKIKKWKKISQISLLINLSILIFLIISN